MVVEVAAPAVETAPELVEVRRFDHQEGRTVLLDLGQLERTQGRLLPQQLASPDIVLAFPEGKKRPVGFAGEAAEVFGHDGGHQVAVVEVPIVELFLYLLGKRV